MKKLVTIGLICLVFFVSLAALSNNPQFSMIQNQSDSVRVNLTHQATNIFSMDCFNVSNSQYLNTEGNDTLSLIANGTTQDYLGLYSFTGEVNGTHPIDWTITETGNATVEVIENRTDHHKVVELYSEAGTYYAVMKNTFADAGVNKVELWVYSNSNGDNIQIEILHGVTQVIYIEFDWGMSLVYTWSGGSFENLQAITVERWYHTRIDFSSTSDDYDVYIDGILKGVNRAYITSVDHLDTMQITGVGETYGNATAYIDAVDYGWAEGYYTGRNNDTGGIHEAEGSYVSPIIDLGAYNNYFIEYINLSYTTPDDSDLAASAQFSTDNITWSGWLLLGGLPNVTAGFEAGRYIQFYVNLTASSDTFDTPELYDLLVQFEETILNEIPSFADIAPANNSVGLNPNVPINCTILDADADLLNITLYVNDTIVNGASNCANGSFFYFLLPANYSTSYTFYFELTDGENITTSSLYCFTTGIEPEDEEEEPSSRTATIHDVFITIGAVGFVLLMAAANTRKRRL